MASSWAVVMGWWLACQAAQGLSAIQMQDPSPPPAAAEPMLDRVTRLEARVLELETILFANLQINVFEAERRVAEARQRSNDSRELYFRGLLSEVQFQHDQFELERLERELELLRTPSGHRILLGELEVRDAERRVEEARYRARFSESLLVRGYITQREMTRLQEAVALSETHLELARQKLEAVRRLEALQTPPPEPMTEVPKPPPRDQD